MVCALDKISVLVSLSRKLTVLFIAKGLNIDFFSLKMWLNVTQAWFFLSIQFKIDTYKLYP